LTQPGSIMRRSYLFGFLIFNCMMWYLISFSFLSSTEEVALTSMMGSSAVVPGRVVLVMSSDYKFSPKKGVFMDINHELENRRQWAQRNGHDFYFHNASGIVWSMWFKPDVIKQAFAQNPKAEWAWWFDSDGLIMEYHYNFSDRVLSQAAFDNIGEKYKAKSKFTNVTATMAPRPYADTHFIVTHDHNGFNCGSFLMRRGVVTEAALDLWGSSILIEWTKGLLEEQAALAHVMITVPFVRDRTTWIERSLINVYRGDYKAQEKHLAVHLAGCRRATCKPAFSYMSRLREKNKQKALKERQS